MFLAYKYVAVALMMAEINYMGFRLGLPMNMPVHANEVKRAIVFPPTPLMPSFGGRLDVDGFAFSFSNNGRLCYIWKIKPFGTLTIPARNYMLRQSKSDISTNEAYQIATNWLNEMSVNTSVVERNYPVEVKQEFQVRYPSKTVELLPLFEITWGDGTHPTILVEIDGRNKELLRLRLSDDSVSERPAGLITNRDQLAAISDKDFSSYSQKQRRKLIEEFEAIKYGFPKPYPLEYSGVHTNDDILNTIND
jgi:hypothetical protein